MKSFPISPKTQGQMDRAFMAHPLSSDQNIRTEQAFQIIEGTCRRLCSFCSEGPEQEQMINKFREALYWAKDAISKSKDPA